MIDIDQLFEQTIEQLQQGSRPRYPFSQEQQQFLVETCKQHRSDHEMLTKILCIVDHMQGDSPLWEELIIEFLKPQTHDEILIHIMGISHRQVINRAQRQGDRLSFDFIQAFNPLLDSQNPEVLEWVLRTIEQMGAQSILLKEKVLDKKPGLKRLFNQHLKNGYEIIELLERRWKR